MLSFCRMAHQGTRILYKSKYYNQMISIHVSSSSIRANSTSTAGKVKPTPALVQQLRKQTSCTIQKAIQALTESANNYDQALVWLQNDKAASGQKALQKLAGRVAGNGLIVISPLSNGRFVGGNLQVGNIGIPLRIGMVEVNCETDFVARSPVFEKLCRDLAWSVGFYADGEIGMTSTSQPSPTGEQKYTQLVDVQSIMEAPMLYEPSADTNTPTPSPGTGAQSNTVHGAIAQTIGLVGEKISLKRAAVISAPAFPLAISSQSHSSTTPTPLQDFTPTALSVGIYAHNSTTPKDVRSTSGTIGAAVLTRIRASNLKELILPPTEQDGATPKGGREDWRSEYKQLERALARQVVGYPTSGVRSDGGDAEASEGGPLPLYSQAFDTYSAIASRNSRYEQLPLERVEQALKAWSVASGMESGEVEVLNYLKWSVGEE